MLGRNHMLLHHGDLVSGLLDANGLVIGFPENFQGQSLNGYNTGESKKTTFLGTLSCWNPKSALKLIYSPLSQFVSSLFQIVLHFSLSQTDSSSLLPERRTSLAVSLCSPGYKTEHTPFPKLMLPAWLSLSPFHTGQAASGLLVCLVINKHNVWNHCSAPRRTRE